MTCLSKDKNHPIEDDIKDSEPDAASKKQAMGLAKNSVTAGDEANRHPTEIMPSLWALTVYKGVRGFRFVPLDADSFEIYMHGSKKRSDIFSSYFPFATFNLMSLGSPLAKFQTNPYIGWSGLFFSS